MNPTLSPGDRVLVVGGLGPLRPPLRVGDLVAVVDPRDAGRIVVKRVAAVEEGLVDVRGDNEAASTDSRHFGPVAAGAVITGAARSERVEKLTPVHGPPPYWSAACSHRR